MFRALGLICTLVLCAQPVWAALPSEAPVSASATKRPLAAPVQIKVLSLNVWGLPAPIGRQLSERMERIAEAVQPYDVVLLQETFDQTTADLPVRAAFPYAYHHLNGDLWHQSSGLMVLSRYPIVETDFMPFPHAVIPDAFANKGVLFTRIRHPELGFVDLYNTHYQSREGEEPAEVRTQTDNPTLVRLLLKHNRYYPTVLGGDFNFYPDKREYRDLHRRLDLIDTYASARPVAAEGQRISHHTHPSWIAYSDKETRIDYIFALKSALWNYRVTDTRIVFREPIRGHMLSDHLGVSTTLEISPVFPHPDHSPLYP